jgi:hypothetical protein
MTCPSSCHQTGCTMTYAEHLRGIQISPAAMPTRSVTRTEGQQDESTTVTRAREKTMERDLPAYKALREQGYRPRSVWGTDRLSATATSDAQIEGRPE